MPPAKLGTASSTSLGASCPSDCAIGLTTVSRFDRWYKSVCCRKTTRGQGVHREVESEGLAEKYRAAIEGATPAMNRSAKDGTRSSWHYGSDGALIHSVIPVVTLPGL